MQFVGRLAIVVGVLLLGWLGSVRREASIATTPAGVDANAEVSASANGEREQEQPLSSPQRRESSDAPQDQLHRQIPSRSVSKNQRPADPSLLQDLPGSISDIAHRTSHIIPVPFVSQAPLRVWELPYKEFCEEASVYTVHLWKSGGRPGTATDLDRALKEIQAWEEAHLGRWEDTTAEETARILRERFGHTNTRVVRNVTVLDIKRELDAGRPVIVPARGREIDSPYFTPPGPIYHMLVIIGYDDARGQWITNDVGTNTKGAGQRYTYDDLYDAIADWSHERQAPIGGKVMIVVE